MVKVEIDESEHALGPEHKKLVDQMLENFVSGRESHVLALASDEIEWVGEPKECDDCDQRAEFEITTVMREGVPPSDSDVLYMCGWHHADSLFSVIVNANGVNRRFRDADYFVVRPLCYVKD